MKRPIIFFFALFSLGLFLIGGCSSFRRRPAASADAESARQTHEIRQATQRYLDIEMAKGDGYFRASGYIPSMGYQFINPKFVPGFDLRRPPILLYDERDGKWELLGAGFVAERDKNPARFFPFRGAEYMKRPGACHYQDGTTLPSDNAEDCPKEHPLTRAPFAWWHGTLWMMSAWVWYPNPNGLFSLYNPLLQFPVAP